MLSVIFLIYNLFPMSSLCLRVLVIAQMSYLYDVMRLDIVLYKSEYFSQCIFMMYILWIFINFVSMP